MSDQQTHTILRFAILFFLIMAGFAVVVIKIITIQTVEKPLWQKVEAKQVKNDIVVMPNRGNILDTHGNLLATSIPLYDVHMDTRVEALHLGGDTLFKKYVDSIATGLSVILGDTSAKVYRAKMLKAFYNPRKNRRDIVIRRSVNYIQMREIEKLPLVKEGYYRSGFYFEDRHRRSKPYGSLGSRTIGNIYGESGIGYAGLEKTFEPYLHGTEGLSSKQKVAGKKRVIPLREAIDGADVVTCLDTRLMDICETALRNRLEIVKGEWGCCILMETKTGEIKAISNLDRAEDGTYSEVSNHAVKRVEPGSIFKTMSLLAVLDDSKMDIDDTIRVTRGCTTTAVTAIRTPRTPSIHCAVRWPFRVTLPLPRW